LEAAILEACLTGDWLESLEPKHGNKHSYKNMLHTPGVELQAAMDDQPISHMAVTKVFINLDSKVKDTFERRVE